MEEHVFSRRKVAGGLTCVAAGAMVLALGVAAPAGATEGPQVESGQGWSADQLSDRFGGDWAEVEVPFESGRHVIDDRGTPDAGDDAWVDVQVNGDEVSWTSNEQSIGAVEVPGDDGANLYTYGGSGSRSGHGLHGPGGGGEDRGDRGDRGGWGGGGHGGGGWGGGGGHGGGGIGFCWKKPGGHDRPPTTHPPMPTTVPPTTAPPTTHPPETTVPPTTAPPETTAPPAPSTTLPETEATTPTTQPVGEELPRTGNNTMPLLVGAFALVALGGGAFAGRRYLQQRVQ
jgi:LPXTG-motif cell wall-anchored protein